MEKKLRAQKKYNIKGFTIYVLLALVSLVYITFFGMQNSAMNSLAKVHYTLTIEEVRKISISMVNSIFSYISYKCRTEPASDIAQFFNSDECRKFELDVGRDPLLANMFDVFKPAVVEKITISTEKDGEGAVSAMASDGYDDPFERTRVVELSARVVINGLKYECRVRRILARAMASVPLYSKFTLMIRGNNINKWAYNLFLNSIAGLPDKNNKFLPIVFLNHNVREDPESSTMLYGEKSYRKRGYIYFGSETILNKTSGISREYSELFHFAKFDEKEIGVLKFYSTSDGVPFSPPNPPGGYMAEYIPLGFYRNMFADPTAPYVFKKYFGMLAFSSVLHLYGNFDQPSSTAVFGKVFHSYPIYKSIVNDLNQNSETDFSPSEHVLANSLKNRPRFFNSLELSKFSADFIMKSGKSHQNWADFCANSYDNYSKIMSVIVKEPYNNVYNYMLYKGFLSTDTKSNINLVSEDELSKFLDPTNFKLSVKGAGSSEKVIFSGDPGQADISKLLLDKVQKEYADQREFFKECLKDGKLTIKPCVVKIRNGPVVFPENTEVSEGGVLVLENGDFEVRGINGRPEGKILSLFAVKGNINIDAGRKCRYVSLNAPEGFVRNISMSPAALSLTGNIVCKYFDHLSFAAGGTVEYSHYLDPTNEKFAGARYKYMLLPNVLSFKFNRL